jgi:hypothetical protein
VAHREFDRELARHPRFDLARARRRLEQASFLPAIWDQICLTSFNALLTERTLDKNRFRSSFVGKNATAKTARLYRQVE